MLTARALLPALLAAPLLAACSSGGRGDAPSTPRADQYGDGARISDLVVEATWLDPDNLNSEDCQQPPDRSAYVTGVTILAVDRYDETGEGSLGNFYVQDSAGEPAPYSGVTVFDPSFSPPDLRLAPGDVADVLGVFTEFIGPSVGRFGYCRTLPEIGGTMSFRFENGHVDPLVVPLKDLMSYASARRYIGMLVRVEDVSIAGEPANSGGRYTASLDVGAGVPASDVPKVSNELYDIGGDGPTLTNGSAFAAITGVVTYFYGFKIAPRSPADFEL